MRTIALLLFLPIFAHAGESIVSKNAKLEKCAEDRVKIEPGDHSIELSAPPLSPGWTGGTALVTMQLKVEPCKRYYINGTYANPLGMDWTPFIDYVDNISGCTVTALP